MTYYRFTNRLTKWQTTVDAESPKQAWGNMEFPNPPPREDPRIVQGRRESDDDYQRRQERYYQWRMRRFAVYNHQNVRVMREPINSIVIDMTTSPPSWGKEFIPDPDKIADARRVQYVDAVRILGFAIFPRTVWLYYFYRDDKGALYTRKRPATIDVSPEALYDRINWGPALLWMKPKETTLEKLSKYFAYTAALLGIFYFGILVFGGK